MAKAKTVDEVKELAQALEAQREEAERAEAEALKHPSNEAVVRRSADPNGIPVMVMSLKEAADSLAVSSFMRPWIIERIKEALRSGSIFTMDKTDDPFADARYSTGQSRRAEYQMASKQDLLELASGGVRQTTIRKAVAAHISTAAAPSSITTAEGEVIERPTRTRTAAAPKRTAKAALVFRFTIPKQGKKRDERFAELSKQARSIMDIIADADQPELNQDALTHILQEGAPAKGLDPKTVYSRFYRFGFTPGYEVYQGLVTKVV